MKMITDGKINKPLFTSSWSFGTAPLVACLVLTFGTLKGWSQGVVNFDTKSVGAICYSCWGDKLEGKAFFAQLYAAAGLNAPESSLAKVGTRVNFRTGINAGFVQTSGFTSDGVQVNPTVTVPTSSPGGATTIQMRTWSSQSPSYDEAVGSSDWGSSPTLNLVATGNPAGDPPTTPVDLIGLQGFQMSGVCPEPSTYVMLGSGILALFFCGRRKLPTI